MDLDSARAQFAYAGDSPNDSPMFAYFPASVGVANVGDILHLLPHKPAYVTNASGGEGFAEMAERLLGLRQLA